MVLEITMMKGSKLPTEVNLLAIHAVHELQISLQLVSNAMHVALEDLLIRLVVHIEKQKFARPIPKYVDVDLI
jgi:hypothetical protein